MAGLAIAAWALAQSGASAQKQSRFQVVRSPENGAVPANPYLAFLPEDVQPDWAYWNTLLQAEAHRRAESATPRFDAVVAETENNDFYELADPLPNFGTGPGQNLDVAYFGTAGVKDTVRSTEAIEDNGSIFYATTIPSPNPNNVFVVTGEIGDGPYGGEVFSTGDYDFYRIPSVTAGQTIEVQVVANRLDDGATLDPMVAVYGPSGELVDFAQDNAIVLFDNRLWFVDLDCELRVRASVSGTYYVAISADRDLPLDPEDLTLDPAPLIGNPFNSASGAGIFSEGLYQAYIRVLSPGTPRAEDNGSINRPSIVPPGGGVFESFLGDGPQIAGGDFDFYALTGMKRGDLLTVQVNAELIGSTLDPFVAIWDSSGNLLAWNDDNPYMMYEIVVPGEDEAEDLTVIFFTLDSLATCVVPANGTYYVSVGSFGSGMPLDPFDPSSGVGSATTGDYEVVFRLQPNDPDVIRLDLVKGDVVSCSLSFQHPFGYLELLGESGQFSAGTHTNLTGIFPVASPVRIDGDTALTHVATRTGPHYFRFSSHFFGDYSANVKIARPGLEFSEAPEPRQILFLDFHGPTPIDRATFDIGEGIANLSGLESFLTRWGLDPATDLNRVIDAILREVTESLRTDLVEPNGANRFFDIEIRNSRDHADTFGSEINVSRVIVGGTVSEAGVQTIGLAQTIDPGNFDTGESAFVLLDLLSEAPTNPNSLNGVPRAAGKSIVDLIGRAVGNIVAHEAGHFFGNFHTDNSVTAPNIMDAGGNLDNIMGVGPDGIFGNADDIDVDFGVDKFDFLEGFVGFEDTLNTTAFGLSAVPGSIIYVDFNAAKNGVGTFALPFNKLKSGISAVPIGGTIRILPGKTAETFRDESAIGKRMTVENGNPLSGSALVGKQAAVP